jgi:hypothetical protein
MGERQGHSGSSKEDIPSNGGRKNTDGNTNQLML